MKILGNCPSIAHLPIGPLKSLGTNMYDEPLFRVVWSESRYYLVGGTHKEYSGTPATDKELQLAGKDINIDREFIGYKWLPLYPGHGRWVLELWKSPLAFAGCSKEQWELLYRDPLTNLITLGPYPERGEYCECSVPLSRSPGRDEVLRGIALVRAGWNYSFNDKKVANQEALQKSETDKFNQFQDMFKDSQQAFNNKPSNIRPGKRTAGQVKLGTLPRGMSRRTGFQTGTPQRSSNAGNR